MAYFRCGAGNNNNDFIQIVDHQYIKDITSSSWTSKTFNIESGDTIILCLMHRNRNIALSENGFTLHKTTTNSSMWQYGSIYSKKYAIDTQMTLTITPTSGRFEPFLLQLRGPVNISNWTDNDYCDPSEASEPSISYTLVNPEKPALLFCHNGYAGDGNCHWVITADNSEYMSDFTSCNISEWWSAIGNDCRCALLMNFGFSTTQTTLEPRERHYETLGVYLA